MSERYGQAALSRLSVPRYGVKYHGLAEPRSGGADRTYNHQHALRCGRSACHTAVRPGAGSRLGDDARGGVDPAVHSLAGRRRNNPATGHQGGERPLARRRPPRTRRVRLSLTCNIFRRAGLKVRVSARDPQSGQRTEAPVFAMRIDADARSWAGDMHVHLYEDGTIAVGPVHPDGPLSIAEATRLRDALGAAIAAATAATN